MKKTLCLILVLVLMLSLVPVGCAADQKTALEKTLAYYDQNPVLTSWEEVVALKSAGADLTEFTLPLLSKEDLQYGAATVAADILACLAMDRNPRTYFAETDLVKLLAGMQREDGSFGTSVNADVYAILALENTAPAAYDREKALQYLLSQQFESGAFGYTDPSWTSEDIDLTGMVLEALAHFKGEAVDKSVAAAVAWLETKRMAEGGFPSFDGKENANSAAMVLSGLVAVGADLTSWQGTIDSLLSFQLPDGGFVYTAEETEANALATRQALIALTDLAAGKNVYQRMETELPRVELLYADGQAVGNTLAGYVAEAYDLGLLLGNTDQTYRPKKTLAWWEFEIVMERIGLAVQAEDGQAPVKREEVAVALAKALNLPKSEVQAADIGEATQTREVLDAVSAVMGAKIMEGVGGGMFRPQGNLSREELAKVVVLASQYGK